MTQLKDNSSRARTAIILMSFFFGVSMISLIVEFSQYSLLGRIEAGNFTMEEVETNDVMVKIIGIVSIILNILSVVYFIMWFRRAYYNLTQIPDANVSYGEGWAAGGWFVPILNWFRPFEIMKEIWYDTQKHSGSNEEEEAGNMLGFWWACWILGSILSNVSSRMAFGDPSFDELKTSIILSIVANIILIPAFVLVIKIIKKISGFERTMFENRNDMDIEAHLISTPVNS